MIGLTGARVIVVDDNEREALPIIKAFSKKGVPSIFFDGRVRSLPTRDDRISGVRLAILDMDLVGGGSPANMASALVNYLERILSPQNGPYIALIWTNHPELRETVERYLFLDQNVPTPIFTVMLTKAECKTLKGTFDLAILSRKIKETLVNVSPLLILQGWEGKCFAAATEVTNTLADLAIAETDDLNDWRNLWKSQMLRLMYAIAQAALGKSLDRDSVLNGLYSSLNPLHADRMESRTTRLCSQLSSNSDEILAFSTGCGVKQKARVNTMLHLSFENLEKFCAGNIYMFSARKKPRTFPGVGQLLDDLRQREKDAQKEEDSKDEMAGVSKAVFIEVGATCDHAQDNVRIARFIAGLIVPAGNSKRIKKADFIWKLGPVFLGTPIAAKGEYYLYFSARHLVTHDLKQAVKLKAAVRMRGQALIDLQAWFSRQASRPGLMLLL